jgi:hypothetical protein
VDKRLGAKNAKPFSLENYTFRRSDYYEMLQNSRSNTLS